MVYHYFAPYHGKSPADAHASAVKTVLKSRKRQGALLSLKFHVEIIILVFFEGKYPRNVNDIATAAAQVSNTTPFLLPARDAPSPRYHSLPLGLLKWFEFDFVDTGLVKCRLMSGKDTAVLQRFVVRRETPAALEKKRNKEISRSKRSKKSTVAVLYSKYLHPSISLLVFLGSYTHSSSSSCTNPN